MGATDTYRRMSLGLGGTQKGKGERDNLQTFSLYMYLTFRFVYSQAEIIMSKMLLPIYEYLYLYSPFVSDWPYFQFLNPTHSR
jgi:hypothetical protein